jgi:phage recombination protein Bet
MSEVAVIQTRELLSSGDLEVLKNSKFKNFTLQEINYARSVCSHLRLNPILNQIHFVKRKNTDGTYSVTPQVGIDGFRLEAERTGKYAGSDEAVFEYNVGDAQKKRPAKATVTVYKMVHGVRVPFTASARWDEYYPGDSSKEAWMWRKMPHGQLAKCAEALALRKAFPAELSALRTDEEMAQAARETTPSKANSLNARTAPKASDSEVQDAEFTDVPPEPAPPKEDLGEYVCQVGKKFKGKKLKDISMEELSSFVSWIREQDDASEALTAFAEKAEAFLANGTDVTEPE